LDAQLQPTAPAIDPHRPLVIVDVDEVLGLFMHGFARFIEPHGYELRLDRFALFQNIFAPGAAEHLDIAAGRGLFDEFFRIGCEAMEPTPHAPESLRALSQNASVVIMTNAPDHAREPRLRWLARTGMDYPMVINSGPKGAAVAALAARTRGPAAFVDDLLGNLESVATEAPAVHRFQLVADPRLRPLAPAAPDRHRRIDDWPSLRAAIEQVLGLAAP
jgi:hypothetical protein